MSFSQKTKHIALVGDFNSRTSNLTDYILPGEEMINEILDIVDDVIESMFSHQILQHHDIPLDRYSEDRARPNTYGMDLIELCKHCSLFTQALVARTYPPPPFFLTFCLDLFSIKFLYFFIISSLFPYFNLFVSIFIQSYVNIKLHVSKMIYCFE